MPAACPNAMPAACPNAIPARGVPEVRVGLALPHFDFSIAGEDPLPWATLAGWARQAEALGFESLWVADHLFLDLRRHGGPPGLFGSYDPLVALAAVARITRRVRLGTLVLCTPLRPVTVLAKALATLDVVSGGRLVAGLGAGWYEPELDAAGLALERPAARLAHLEEACEVLRGMFGGGPYSFDGGHVRAVDARCRPRPLQRPHPPIWVGGRGDRLLGVVARRADGWNTAWTSTPDSYRERLRVLQAACEAAGRDPATVTRSLGLYTLVGEDRRDLRQRFDRLRDLSPAGVMNGRSLDDWRRGRLVGTVDEVREQAAEWEALGVDTLLLSVGPVPFSVTVADDVALAAASLVGDEPRTD
jgi:probable F420-dependent oxidoreductase